MYILPFGIPKYPPGWNIPARQNEFNINNQLKVMWRSNQFVKTGIGDCRYSFIYWNNDFSELDESINIKSTTVKSHTHTHKKNWKQSVVNWNAYFQSKKPAALKTILYTISYRNKCVFSLVHVSCNNLMISQRRCSNGILITHFSFLRYVII